ncbi:MAG: alpha/beta fold hydrolase, partial [Anaerolineae bacterium]|nr:alpha/beta fold hydrolase [Anaerolineae bacterium]
MAMQAAPELVIHDGLAIYRLGDGEPLLLFPYPHGSTFRSMAENPLARLLAGLGRHVITCDPPSACRSTRPMRCDLAEMLDCAAEALQVHRVDPPVDVAGHSMGSLCALGLAVERPQLVRRLV